MIIMRRLTLTDIRVLGRWETSVRPLGSPQPKLQQSHVLARGNAVASSIGSHQAETCTSRAFTPGPNEQPLQLTMTHSMQSLHQKLVPKLVLIITTLKCSLQHVALLLTFKKISNFFNCYNALLSLILY